MTMNDLSKYCIGFDKSIREAFKKMDSNKRKFVLVVNDYEKVIGIVTDGDFRRAIWNGVSLEENVGKITNEKFVYFQGNYDVNRIKEVFITSNIGQIPILEDGILTNVIFRDDLSNYGSDLTKIELPVVIMAGGLGSRLDPFTRILPKALIPVGEKPVIEVIMDEFAKYGMKCFYVSVNHKAKMIKAFFEDFDKGYTIKYITEEQPLGTAGSLRYLYNVVETPLFVSNCDILVNHDYTKIYEFHMEGSYDLTLVASMQHHVIPYGVCKIENGGKLKEIKEKPEYDFLVNTGMYILNPEVLRFIPYKESFAFTDLVGKLKQVGKKVGVYPVTEKAWIDIGQWEEYKKSLKKLALH